MLSNRDQPSLDVPGLARTWPFWILSLILFCLAGCGAKAPGAGKQTPGQSGSISKEAPAELSLQDHNPVSTSRTEPPQRVELHTEQNKRILSIPVPDGTSIAPSYAQKSMQLTFAPALPRLQASNLAQEGLIKDVSVQPQPEGVEQLHLDLNQPVRFLITRPRPTLAKLHLIPGPSRQDSQADQASARLTDLDFVPEPQGGLRLTLKATGSLDYHLQPGHTNGLALVFPGLQVPPRLVKLYNLSKFKAEARSALLTQTGEGARLVLAGPDNPVSISREPQAVTLHIPARTKDSQVAASASSSEPARDQLDSPRQHTSSDPQTPLYPGMKEHYTGSPISLNLQDADIEHVLRLISEVAGYNLILDQAVSGTISLKLDRVPWDQALDLVLQQKDLGMVKRGNILRIAPATELEKEQQRILEARKAALQARQNEQDLAPLRTEYIQVNYTKAGDLQSKLTQFLTERGKISFDARTNQLIVSDTAQTIATIRSVVRKLDRAERQVLIEARLVYATDQFQRSLGLKWGGNYESTDDGQTYELFGTNDGYAVNLPNAGTSTLGLGTIFSKLTGNELYTLDAQLELGENQDQVKTISSPRVVTLNNQAAEIVQGTKIATKAESESGGTTTEYVEATLKLSVTPQVTPDNKLILDLDISDDSPVSGGEDIETRSVQTRLIVDNNQTVVIGGVQQINRSNTQDRVPGLSRTPLLGWLFKNTSTRRDKRELLVFIRPHIL